MPFACRYSRPSNTSCIADRASSSGMRAHARPPPPPPPFGHCAGGCCSARPSTYCMTSRSASLHGSSITSCSLTMLGWDSRSRMEISASQSPPLPACGALPAPPRTAPACVSGSASSASDGSAVATVAAGALMLVCAADVTDATEHPALWLLLPRLPTGREAESSVDEYGDASTAPPPASALPRAALAARPVIPSERLVITGAAAAVSIEQRIGNEPDSVSVAAPATAAAVASAAPPSQETA
eukprot:281817-Chlamydomonas_euryale.AAC.5